MHCTLHYGGAMLFFFLFSEYGHEEIFSESGMKNYCNFLCKTCEESLVFFLLYKISSGQVSSYSDLLEMANLSTLKKQKDQDIAILMYKVRNNLCPSYISNLFQSSNTQYNLRNSNLSLPRFNTITFGKTR